MEPLGEQFRVGLLLSGWRVPGPAWAFVFFSSALLPEPPKYPSRRPLGSPEGLQVLKM